MNLQQIRDVRDSLQKLIEVPSDSRHIEVRGESGMRVDTVTVCVRIVGANLGLVGIQFLDHYEREVVRDIDQVVNMAHLMVEHCGDIDRAVAQLLGLDAREVKQYLYDIAIKIPIKGAASSA